MVFTPTCDGLRNHRMQDLYMSEVSKIRNHTLLPVHKTPVYLLRPVRIFVDKDNQRSKLLLCGVEGTACLPKTGVPIDGVNRMASENLLPRGPASLENAPTALT